MHSVSLSAIQFANHLEYSMWHVCLALIEKQLQLLISGKWVDQDEKKSEARTRFLIARSLEFLVYEKTMTEVSFGPKPLFLSSAHLFICESCSGKTSK